MVRINLSIAFLFLCIVGVCQDGRHQVEVVSSQFNIEGKTNVNSFECGLFQEVSEDMLRVTSQWAHPRLTFKGLRFRYRANNFDCGVEPMNNDLRDLLKTETYPYLYLEIHSIELNPDNKAIEELNVAAEVSITLSGVTRRYSIEDGIVINRSEEDLSFMGKKTLKLTDFNIEPPTKFFGLVQVTDELKIDFELNMHVEAY